MEVLAIVIRKGKEIKGIQIGKEEVKLSLFADDMKLYIENSKDATRKLLELTNEFDKIQEICKIICKKIARYKPNIQKSIAFLYTNNELSERDIKETIPFIIPSKRIKYLEINLLIEVKYQYLENYEILI